MEFDQLQNLVFAYLRGWLPKIGIAIFILIIFIILGKLARRMIIKLGVQFSIDRHLVFLLGRTANIIIQIIGIITVLGTLGINVTALVAGLGLTGFALGFALKDTIANLLAGLLILLYRPFIVGDKVRISGYEGKVISIDLRYTILEKESDKYLIPNAKLFTDPITVLDSV